MTELKNPTAHLARLNESENMARRARANRIKMIADLGEWLTRRKPRGTPAFVEIACLGYLCHLKEIEAKYQSEVFETTDR